MTMRDLPEGLKTFRLFAKTVVVHAPQSWPDEESERVHKEVQKEFDAYLYALRRTLLEKYPALWVTAEA